MKSKVGAYRTLATSSGLMDLPPPSVYEVDKNSVGSVATSTWRGETHIILSGFKGTAQEIMDRLEKRKKQGPVLEGPSIPDPRKV